MQHGESLARETGDSSLAEAVASGRWQELDERTRALCAYAVKLTRTPGEMIEDDLSRLRELGLDDRAIVDANQVVSYFNYVNRIADGLGVELEAEWPQELRIRKRYPIAASDLPGVEADELAWLTVDQMREVDRLMTEELGITLERMMENAGRLLSLFVIRLLRGSFARRVVVLAGTGGNGGGGRVAARHLANAGAQVEVVLASDPDRLAPVTRDQYEILTRIGVPVTVSASPRLATPEIVVDALLGYSQANAPHGQTASLIEWAEGRRVVSLDVPSGLELTTGHLHAPHIEAEATLTLAQPKTGLRAPGVGAAVGALYLADISVPPLVYTRLGLEYRTPFARGPIVRVEIDG